MYEYEAVRNEICAHDEDNVAFMFIQVFMTLFLMILVIFIIMIITSLVYYFISLLLGIDGINKKLQIEKEGEKNNGIETIVNKDD